METSLIITGCPGFIGLNFFEYIEKIHKDLYYDNIFLIDLFEKYKANEFNINFYKKIKYKLFSYNKRIIEYKIDISDKKKFEEKILNILNNYKTVYDIVNFASFSHIDNSIKNPHLYFENNITLVSNLTKINNIKNFYHISTDEVYGHIELQNVFNEKYWFTPESCINPRNPYSASKASQDIFLLSLYNTFKFPLKILRLSNQFGPYQYPEKLIPKIIKCAFDQKPFGLYGNGLNIRQWTPVKDTVKIIWDIILNKDKYPDLIYHISYPPSEICLKNNKFMVEKIYEILETYNIKGFYFFVADRLGHDQAYVLKNTVNWNEFFEKSWEERLNETINFYVQNKHIYSMI